MASADIALKAKAGKLLAEGHKEFEGYRKMATADLTKLVAAAEGKGGTKGTTAAKGAATNGASAKGKAATPAKGAAAQKSAPAKGKTTTATKGKVSPAPAKGKTSTTASKGKPAPAAKSTAQKSTPAKGVAAQGKAKRPATAKGNALALSAAQKAAAQKAAATVPAGKCKNHPRRKAVQTRGIYAGLCAECVEEAKAARGSSTAPTKGVKGGVQAANRAKGAPAKGKAASPAKGKAAPVKGAPAKGKTTGGKGKPVEGRANLDRANIDWKAESNVGGRGGKRGDVMARLRVRRGDTAKVFDDLQENAVKWYPNAKNSYPASPTRKHAAERMLIWLINRVALDFARATGQHQSGTRAGYGESEKPQDIRRREAREAARKEREKATRGAKGGSTKGKAAAPAKGRAVAAAKGKGAAPAKGRAPAKGKAPAKGRAK